MKVPDFYIDLLTAAIVPIAFVLVVGGIYSMVAGRGKEAAGASLTPVLPLHELAAACGFIVIPFVCVVLAKVATGAFVNRYATPAVIGFAVLAGFGTAVSFSRSAAMRLVITVSLTGWFVLSQAREFIEPTGFSLPVSRAQVDRANEWLANQDPELPVVVADAQSFTVLSHYGSQEVRSRMVYLADPDLALKRLGHNSVERGMLDLLRPWFRLNVLEFEPYVAAHARFLVYGDSGHHPGARRHPGAWPTCCRRMSVRCAATADSPWPNPCRPRAVQLGETEKVLAAEHDEGRRRAAARCCWASPTCRHPMRPTGQSGDDNPLRHRPGRSP